MEGAVATTLKYNSLGGQTVMRDEEGLKYLPEPWRAKAAAVRPGQSGIDHRGVLE